MSLIYETLRKTITDWNHHWCVLEMSKELPHDEAKYQKQKRIKNMVHHVCVITSSLCFVVAYD